MVQVWQQIYVQEQGLSLEADEVHCLPVRIDLLRGVGITRHGSIIW